jgi:hypothetical protein
MDFHVRGTMKERQPGGAALRLAPLFLLILLVSCGSPPTVTLALMGDLMLGRGVEAGTDSLAILKSTLERADLVLGNLESPLSTSPPAASSDYDLCTEASNAGLMQDWGINMLSLANNHALDCSDDGFLETSAILSAKGITPITPASQVIHQQINSINLAFIALDDVSSPRRVRS